MSSLLKTYIIALLNEAAIQAKDVPNLALYESSPPNYMQDGDSLFVLYNPQKVLEEINEWKSIQDYEQIIYGMVLLDHHQGDCNDASEVRYSAAKKGYGPLLYDIAGTSAFGGIMADRLYGVSPDAKRVWDYYYDKRQDVQAIPLDDEEDPKDEDPSNDCKIYENPPLDHSYAGMHVSYGNLVQSHQKVVDSLKEYEITSEQFNEQIETLAEMFFYARKGGLI